MTQTFTQDVLIDGSQDTTQLRVQSNTTQTDPLQTWEDSTGDPLAQMTEDGRLQIGDIGMTTPDALIEAHRESATMPQRGIHSLGRISGALSAAVNWVVGELELLGTGGVSGLQTALRARLTHSNSGDSTEADLRAGDFETINDGGSSGDPVGRATGVRGAVVNTQDAYLDEAAGIDVSVVQEAGGAGAITNAYGVRIWDVEGATNNYALYTNTGLIHLGDAAEIEGAVTLNDNLTVLGSTQLEALDVDGAAQFDGAASFGSTLGVEGIARFDETVELQRLTTVPGTPAANIMRLYPKSDGKLYAKNWSGTEYDLTSSSGGGGGGGGGNGGSPQAYIVGFEVDISASGDDFTIAAGMARDDSDTFTMVLTASGSIDLSTSGIGGLDTGSKANNTWYYAYIIAKADGTTARIASASATTPTLPSGYIYKRRIGAGKTDGSGSLYRQYAFKGQGALRKVVYAEDTNASPFRILNDYDVPNTWTDVDFSSLVPVTARVVHGVQFNAAAGNSGFIVQWREKGISSQVLDTLLLEGDNYAAPIEIPLDASQIAQIIVPSGTADENYNLYVQGYYDNLLPAIVGLSSGDQNAITIGSYVGARPGSPSTGDMYLPDDGTSIEAFDGAAWQQFGPIFPLSKPPTVASFTWVNQDDAVADEANGGIHLHTPPDSTYNLHLLKIAVGLSTPWKLTVCMRGSLIPFTDYVGYGLAYRESSSGKIVTFGVEGVSGAIRYHHFNWNSESSFNSVVSTLNHFEVPMWWQIEDDGTDRIMRVAHSPYDFTADLPAVFSVSSTSFISADEVGFWVKPQNASYGADVRLYSWQLE